MRWIIAALSIWLLVPPSAGAQPGPRETPIERWIRMPPAERQRALAKLPPARRRLIQERIRQYLLLSPEERQALRQRYDRFSDLPPDRQDRARALFREFRALPDDRRHAMRRELQQLRLMSEADRQKRMASEDFRHRFSPSEKLMLQDLARVFNQTP
ncbi:MAG: DUF3106 domain-containing protein [Candidatus Solibacter usitatus]|nr:DUF3106 domain-containing protein [Candidatus Solibacter usitatus]